VFGHVPFEGYRVGHDLVADAAGRAAHVNVIMGIAAS